ncbi:penicillin-binding protein [Radiobacillus kanasensis]|uniref:transglycosylase domain-containing protein n=1 Tax=Radiobacillus kanasensis TaxID=2844358 RepID=UPI001E434818|nr:transglycosylase domain-containing protein [Radiobacillus kanasensis]UFT98055.1 penicillin-binding protein [Radiobacillus kanasensis]
MNKERFAHYIEKLKELWATGVIQKGSRITYDVTWNIILFFLIIGVIGAFFAGGVGAGYFASLVKDEPVRAEEAMEKDLYNYEESSELYFANNTYLGKVRSDLYREETTLENVSTHVKNAIIATEDNTFYTHNGVVPKAILRAILQEALNTSVKTGGSTLTQQLIKNQILTNEVSFERKAKEILLALRLEQFADKDEILQAYLNIVPFGRNAAGQNIAGVQTAAQGIFGIDAKDLNLPQAAYIAGLPQSPSFYTPFKNGGGVKDEAGLEPGFNRMKTVLSRMLESGFITEGEYQKAIQYDLAADFTEPKPSPLDEYPYLTNEIEKRAKEVLSKILAKKDGYTEEDLENSAELKEEYMILAERDLRKSGYKIHTTIDKKIYDVHQDIAAAYDNYGSDKWETVTDPETGETKQVKEPVQVGGILIENKTGKIISFIGGRDFKLENLNHATDAERPNGSTMKPLLVYAPGMEAGVVQPGSIIADVDTVITYPGMPEPYDPGNYASNFHGLVSARTALKQSYNIPAVRTYMQIINNDPASQYLEPMGFTSLTKGDHGYPAVALGGLTNGVTIEENTNAYTTFGNGGKAVDAYIIDKIETVDGEVIYQHESEAVEVFTPQTNYLMLDMMRDVLTSGTATAARANLKYTNVDWAGKTGTSQDWHDTWFVATNPNVTMGMWMGYDTPKPLGGNYSRRNLILWAKLVNAATDINPDLMAPKERFERPGGLVYRSYCKVSGMLPSDVCSELGLVDSDLFNAKFVPKQRDNSLIRGTYVMVNGKSIIAGPNTPKEFTKDDGAAFNPEWLKENGYDKLGDIRQLIPSQGGAWDKISIPSTDEIKNDGKNPNAPSSLKKSGSSTISWKASSSKDVVGYRIYKASKPGGSFKLVGNTTETKMNVGGGKAVYQVKAVDYFGQESGASNTLQIGDFTPEKEKPEEKDDKPVNGGGSNEDSGSGGSNGDGGSGGNGETGDTGGDGGTDGSGGSGGTDGSGGSGGTGDTGGSGGTGGTDGTGGTGGTEE